jgi:hypothetical protein
MLNFFPYGVRQPVKRVRVGRRSHALTAKSRIDQQNCFSVATKVAELADEITDEMETEELKEDEREKLWMAPAPARTASTRTLQTK